MTFILGLKSVDGLVLCSDSLESDGYSKSHVQKLYRFTPNGSEWKEARWSIAWGCAGDTPIIKRFSDKLLDLLANEKPAYNRPRLEELIEMLVKHMHESYPNERLGLVIALWGVVSWNWPDKPNEHERRLYSVHERSDCLSVEERFACSGMDTSLARFLLESVVMDDTKTSEALYLASFVTAVMKERVDGVGGLTHILYYPWLGGHPPVTPPRWIDPVPKFVDEMEKQLFSIDEVERAVKVFCWSRVPHECRIPKNSEAKSLTDNSKQSDDQTSEDQK